MENRVITGVIGVFVVICLVGAALVPIIDNMGEGEPVVNPDAGWIRMNYDASASTYEITISPTDDGVSVTNGTDTQTGADDTIFYADSNLAVWMQDGTVNVLGQNTDGPQFLQPEDAVTITRTADGVSVSDGVTDLSFDSPSWAYVPVSTGTYGFFADGVAASTGGKPIAAVGGGVAGVYAYNDITRYAGLGLTLQTVMENGQITGAYWDKVAPVDGLQSIDPVEPFDPSAITFDPSIIDLDPIDFGSGAQIMSVPTPTYTDGDWGYDLVSGNAKIVSYSGTGGGVIEIPSTVGAYTVTELGKGSSSNYNIFDTSITCTQLVIPSTVTKINNNAFRTCSGLGGELVIPSTVTYVGEYAFRGCSGFTGLSVTDSTVFYGNGGAFWGCSGLTGTAILPKLSNYTSVQNTFSNCSGITSISIPLDAPGVPNDTFAGCTNATGALVIPSNITDLGKRAFDRTKIQTIIYASDAIPYAGTSGDATFYNMSRVSEILDLSSNGVFSENRYYLPDTATIYDSIGDSSGYIGAAIIPGPSGLSDSVMSLMLAIPVVIFGALIAVGAAIFIRRE